MIDKLGEILHSGGHSLVVCNGKIQTYDGRGISDIYKLYKQSPAILNGASVADKVVGKGAAALMVLGGINELYADVISRPALTLLSNAGVSVICNLVVDNIINRQGTGICPVETLCLNCRTATECLPEIERFMQTRS